jgi:leucyl aminopeptidase
MKISFDKAAAPAAGAYVVWATDGGKLTSSGQALDKRLKGALARAIKAQHFEGKLGTGLMLPAPTGTRLDQVYVAGLGKPAEFGEKAAFKVGSHVYAAFAGVAKTVTVAIDALGKGGDDGQALTAEIALGAKLASYRFDKYRTKLTKKDKPILSEVRLACGDPAQARKAYAARDKISQGVFLTRDLVSEPPNVLYPESFARRAQELTALGVKVEVLNRAQMEKLGMHALLGVAQGSTKEARTVIMQWNGAGTGKGSPSSPLAFIGKGVTFDTGGISIKPALNMHDMKWDMGGAGTVVGLMCALAGRNAKVNVVGAIGLVENMPDGNAQRPGDIVTTMSGQTVEVLNTDAEGRLVLCDVLHYVNERFKPKFMIDLATLTGAIIISLGHERAGMFSNDDELSERVFKAGEAVSERVWRLPMGEEYDKMIKSDIADMQNIGGRGAGSITAAQFLQRFVGKTPWAHLDIAGVAWSSKNEPGVPKGATGFGVRLLDRLVTDYYEND